MKGANQVPMDYYPSRMFNRTEVKWLIDSSADANMNILRIWGGGMYMTDYFYEYADRIGMMVWQDMMFSCRFYPYSNEDYLANSVIEVRENAGRMQHHASVVFWDLNNEGKMMFGWGGVRDYAKANKEYNYMYIEHLQPAVAEAGIEITKNYAHSSPTSDSHVYYYSRNCEQDQIFGSF